MIRLQGRGQEHPLCHHPVPAALVPWVCLGSWPPGRGLWEKLLTAPALPLPLPTWAGRRGPWPTLALVAPGGFSPVGQGSGAAEALSSAWDGAAACHVAQHVTALPCCLELSQAEAELAPSGAALGLSLAALGQEPGPERDSHWSQATQQIRDPLGSYWWVGRVLQDLEEPLSGRGSPLKGPLLNLL